MQKIKKTDLSLFGHFLSLALFLTFFILNKSYPLFSTFGLESGNIISILFGPLLAFMSLLYFFDHKKNFKDIFFNEFIWLLIFFIFITILFFLNGKSQKSCSLGAGFLPFLITLLPAISINILLGIYIALLTNKLSASFLDIKLGFALINILF